MSKREAIEQARLTRLRPVLMTGTVAALGFVPMMLSTGIGAEVQRPLATVVVFGMACDTFLTMLALPVLYLLFGKGPRVEADEAIGVLGEGGPRSDEEAGGNGVKRGSPPLITNAFYVSARRPPFTAVRFLLSSTRPLLSTAGDSSVWLPRRAANRTKRRDCERTFKRASVRQHRRALRACL